MEIELVNYINQLIAGDVGVVWDDASKPFITTMPELLDFIESELHVTNVVVNDETLANHWETFNPEILNKKRVFYVNEFDFENIKSELLAEDNYAYIPYKTINETTVLPDDLVYPNEYYFCTDDEFQILKASKL